MLMTTLNRDEYALATAEWGNCVSNFTAIEQLIPTNYIFEMPKEQLDWIKENNQYKDFCTEVGIYKNNLILIFCPLDEKGQRKVMTAYSYSTLCALDGNLVLQEKQEYTIVKNSVLSSDLRRVDNDESMILPVTDKPIMAQDKAVAAIELWRTEGMDWFYLECTEFEGIRVFKRFYVPATDLCLDKPGLLQIKCSFGLKYNDIYQRMLVTLIFISFYQILENNGSAQTISNTYDWSQPCPPICRI